MNSRLLNYTIAGTAYLVSLALAFLCGFFACIVMIKEPLG